MERAFAFFATPALATHGRAIAAVIHVCQGVKAFAPARSRLVRRFFAAKVLDDLADVIGMRFLLAIAAFFATAAFAFARFIFHAFLIGGANRLAVAAMQRIFCKFYAAIAALRRVCRADTAFIAANLTIVTSLVASTAVVGIRRNVHARRTTDDLIGLANHVAAHGCLATVRRVFITVKRVGRTRTFTRHTLHIALTLRIGRTAVLVVGIRIVATVIVQFIAVHTYAFAGRAIRDFRTFVVFGAAVLIVVQKINARAVHQRIVFAARFHT